MIKRIITAILGIPIVLFAVIQGGIMFNFLALAITVAAFFEYCKIVGFKEKLLIYLSVGLAALILFSDVPLVVSIVSLLFLSGLYLRVFNFGETKLENLAQLSWGIIYVHVPIYFLAQLRNLDSGIQIIFLLLMIVWLTDSGAYFSGMFFGKRKLAVKISPKKTIEGAIGGTIVAIIGTVVFNTIFPLGNIMSIVIFALLGSILGQIGDLFESAIKREYNVKDSGNIIPGHGGALDRIDSLLFLMPLAYVFFMYIL